MTRKEKIRARLVEAMQMASDKSLHLILHTSTKGVRKQKNIRYDDTRGRSLLDVYDTPESRDRLRPVFLYFHGGGFTGGSKEPRLYYCAKWAKEGYAAVNVDYICGIDHPFPSFLQQAFRAIEWVFDHAHIHQFDTTRIVLAGESAGAYIAAFIAAISRHHELYDKLNIRFSHRREFNPQACVLISGIYDLEGILSLDFPNIEDCLTGFTGQGREHSLAFVKSSDAKAASPLHYVDERFPPTAVILSDRDPSPIEILLDRAPKRSAKSLPFAASCAWTICAREKLPVCMPADFARIRIMADWRSNAHRHLPPRS